MTAIVDSPEAYAPAPTVTINLDIQATVQIPSNKSQYEPRNEISNNSVCATSKASDQPAHTRSLIRAFAGRLNIL